jgi:PTS system nitrogen regulatory IIA component
MESNDDSLAALIGRGGLIRDIAGASPRDVITGLIAALSLPPCLAGEAARRRLSEAALEREALMSTALGNGIALPHPRNPLIGEPGEQFVAIGYCEQVNWQALDGRPVHTAILIVSASAKLHLYTLSRIHFFCQQESFRALLAARASEEEIIRVIRDAEKTWR